MIKLANILKEITVNKPGPKLEIETYHDIDNTIYVYPLLPIDIEDFIGILTPNGMKVNFGKDNFDLEDNIEWNKVKDYLDSRRIKYYIDDSTIFIPNRYIKIVKELNEITINKPNRGIFKAVTTSDCANDSDLYIYFDL